MKPSLAQQEPTAMQLVLSTTMTVLSVTQGTTAPL